MKNEKYYDYTVTWVMEVSAISAREAAKKAMEIQRSPRPVATMFNVRRCDTKETETIDLFYDDN